MISRNLADKMLQTLQSFLRCLQSIEEKEKWVINRKLKSNIRCRHRNSKWKTIVPQGCSFRIPLASASMLIVLSVLCFRDKTWDFTKKKNIFALFIIFRHAFCSRHSEIKIKLVSRVEIVFPLSTSFGLYLSLAKWYTNMADPYWVL